MGTLTSRPSSPRISLTRNITSAHTLEELKTQIGEFVNKLEDYLNSQVTIHFLQDNRRRPTLIAGDLVFNFINHPEFATLQQWDGKKLIPLDVGSFGGFIDLVAQGVGSGSNSSLFLRSDGAGHWVLGSTSQLEFTSSSSIPAFTIVTVDGEIADSNDLTHFGRILGITTESIGALEIGRAVADEEVTNPTWLWSPNTKLFLNGTSLSASAPTSGFAQMVAVARNDQIIVMKLGTPVLL